MGYCNAQKSGMLVFVKVFTSETVQPLAPEVSAPMMGRKVPKYH